MLTAELDTNLRLAVEPGYKHNFSAAYLAKRANAVAYDKDGARITGPFSARTLWNPPGTGIICLKPLQMLPEFLGAQAQLDKNCVIRLGEFAFNPVDITQGNIREIQIGNSTDPWIEHVPATNIYSTPTRHVQGSLFSGMNLDEIANLSATGSASFYDLAPGMADPAINQLIELGSTFVQEPRNQGYLFRWWQSPLQLNRHAQIYAFCFAQYCCVVKSAVLEVYEDVSPFQVRDQWVLRWRGSLFSPAQTLDAGEFNPDWPMGKDLSGDSRGRFAALWIIPLSRQKVLFLGDRGKYLIGTVRGIPRRTADHQEWDILRSDSVGVAALTPSLGQFQIQRLKYPGFPYSDESGVSSLYLPNIIMDYTPLITPTLRRHFDADGDSILRFFGPITPKVYVFANKPTDDLCPPLTSIATGQQRTFGANFRFIPSSDLRLTPQLYSVEIFAEPIFADNPAAPKVVADQFRSFGGFITHMELSFGIQPGESHCQLTLWDMPDSTGAQPNELDPYRFRVEMPVRVFGVDDMTGLGTAIFAGYTQRQEVRPQRGDAKAPVEHMIRLVDRYFLLEHTTLREQRDWQTEGHITVVDSILRQCGIDTGPLHADGTLHSDGTPSFSGGSLAEYPQGWDDPFLGPLLNTPLATPNQTADNTESAQLTGWRPQPSDTGASFIQRITQYYSNWLFGFRADGKPYYLPYEYFTTPSVLFHRHAGRAVTSGLHLSAGAGLLVHVAAGTATINGVMTTTAQDVAVAPNATNSVYLQSDGTAVSNTTGIAPDNSVGLGTATTDAASVTATDEGNASGRQTATSPTYRRPVEFRTIEPTGNWVQAITSFQLDQTPNRSAIFADWASVKNPQVVNYLGRVKWAFFEIGASFTCPQLNRIAYILFQASRRRRVRVSFDATWVGSLKIGQVFTLEGLGNFRLLEMRATFVRQGWQAANYVGELVETGYGLPEVTVPLAPNPEPPSPPSTPVPAAPARTGPRAPAGGSPAKRPRKKAAAPSESVPALGAG